MYMYMTGFYTPGRWGGDISENPKEDMLAYYECEGIYMYDSVVQLVHL